MAAYEIHVYVPQDKFWAYFNTALNITEAQRYKKIWEDKGYKVKIAEVER